MTTLIFVPAFVVVGIFVYMARFSGRLRIEETLLINAPAAEVYACIADFRKWREWSPWLEHEPEARVTLLGDPAGQGGQYTWEGTRIGTAEISHKQFVVNRSIEQTFTSSKPFRFRGRCLWKIDEQGEKTEVTWAMKGRVSFSLRAFSQTVQGVIALDFRYGLARLARLLEPVQGQHTLAHYSIQYLGIREIAAARYVFRTHSGPLSGISNALRTNFAEIRKELEGADEKSVGVPISAYVRTNIKQRTTTCHMGIMVANPAFDALPVRELPAHKSYVVRLTGSYSALEVAWYQAMQRVRMDGLSPDQRIAPFEHFLNDSNSIPENEWVTELHIPLRAKTKPN